jgi:hypothetical protein
LALHVRERGEAASLTVAEAIAVGWIVRARAEGNLDSLPTDPLELPGDGPVEAHKLAALFALADLLTAATSPDGGSPSPNRPRPAPSAPGVSAAEEDRTDPLRALPRWVTGWSVVEEDGPRVRLDVKARGEDLPLILPALEKLAEQLSPFSPTLRMHGYPAQFARPRIDVQDQHRRPTKRRFEHVFPGLEYYREEDEPLFKGREDDMDELAQRIAAHPLSLLLGESGLGKTSLLHAGLAPHLQRLGWRCVLTRLTARGEPVNWRDFRELLPALPGPLDFAALCEQVGKQGPDGNVLLVIDQFEDLVALTDLALPDLAAALTPVAAGRFPRRTYCWPIAATRKGGWGRCGRTWRAPPSGCPVCTSGR